jgi:catechol 2,3-dioxygenase-like lactoylglutathione lyase family enzyme
MRILETALYAEDLNAARAFYVGLLGLEEITFDPERHLFLRGEGSVLIIFRASKTLIPDAGVPPHGTTGPGHIAFASTHQDLEAWRAKLTQAAVAIVDEIAWPNGARSIYFRDPAGNILEFATPDLWGF